MNLQRYYFKRTLEDTHCDYGIAADSVEPCPIYPEIMIGGGTCINKSCCKAQSKFMRIVGKDHHYIACEETSKMMEKDPSKGQWHDRIVSGFELPHMRDPYLE